MLVCGRSDVGLVDVHGWFWVHFNVMAVLISVYLIVIRNFTDADDFAVVCDYMVQFLLNCDYLTSGGLGLFLWWSLFFGCFWCL